MKVQKITGRTRLFALAHGAICGTMAGALAILLGREYSPFWTGLFFVALFVGHVKYGPCHLNNWDDLKAALRASVTSPYLFWKEIDLRFQTSTTALYDAYVNGVCVGRISDADYRAIQRSVLRDPRVYVAQLLNFGRIVFKMFESFVMGVPTFLFWGMLALAYFEPSVYSEIVGVIQQGPEAVREFVSGYSTLLLRVWLLALVAESFVFVRVRGFENKFDQAVCVLLRQHLKVSAVGDVSLESLAETSSVVARSWE